MREGVAKGYVAHLIEKAGDEADELTIRTAVASLIMVDGASTRSTRRPPPG